MNKALALFCRLVLLLEYIPSYRRYYVWDPEVDIWGPGALKIKPVWRWSWRGSWGINLLARLGLLWRYIDHTNPWTDEDEAEYLGESEDSDNPSSEA